MTYFLFPRSIRFIITFEAAFSASSLDCLAACLASFFARSLASLASWSVDIVRFAVCCSRASITLNEDVRGRDLRSKACCRGLDVRR